MLKSIRKSVRKSIRKSVRKSRKNSYKNVRKSVRKNSHKNVRKSVRKSKKRNDGGVKPFLKKTIDKLIEKGVNVNLSEYDTNRDIKLIYEGSIYDLVEIIPFIKYRIGLNIIERDNRITDIDKATADMSTKIYNSLNSANTNKYALIYCHNRKWNDVRPHWLKNQIEAYCDKNNEEKKPIIYVTIDILEGGDLKYDGFNEKEFINLYKECFDFVFLPDCGGNWATASDSGNYDEINNILNKISLLLKKDGQLLFSKIINESLKSQFKIKIKTDFYKDDDIFKTNNFYKF